MTQMVRIHRRKLHGAGTNGDGFTKEQLALLGVGWPPPAGWMEQLDGMMVDKEIWDEFVGMSNCNTKAIRFTELLGKVVNGLNKMNRRVLQDGEMAELAGYIRTIRHMRNREYTRMEQRAAEEKGK